MRQEFHRDSKNSMKAIQGIKWQSQGNAKRQGLWGNERTIQKERLLVKCMQLGFMQRIKCQSYRKAMSICGFKVYRGGPLPSLAYSQ